MEIKKKNILFGVLVGTSVIAMTLVFCLYVNALAVSAVEMPEELPPDDEFNVVDVPVSDPKDYSEDLTTVNENLVLLQEQIQGLTDAVGQLSVDVSGNKPEDYHVDIKDVSGKLDSVVDALTVSENTVSENNIMTTPLSDYSLKEQLLLLILMVMCFVAVVPVFMH